MRKMIVLALLVPVLGACSGKGQQLASNKNVQADQRQAEQIVQGCLPKGNLLTAAGRKKIYGCLAPPGRQAALQRCAEQDLSKNNVLTPAQRGRFYQGLAVCVERNR